MLWLFRDLNFRIYSFMPQEMIAQAQVFGEYEFKMLLIHLLHLVSKMGGVLSEQMFITPQSGAAYIRYQVFKSRRQSGKSIKVEGSRRQSAQAGGASRFKQKWEGSGRKGQNERKGWHRKWTWLTLGWIRCKQERRKAKKKGRELEVK